jgi:integrase
MRGKVTKLKTDYSLRKVELHPDIAAMLREFVGERKKGFVFVTSKGKPMSQSNILCRHFHPLLKKLRIEKQGFHGFRRFRDTYLSDKTNCPDGVLKFWLGHGANNMTDHYDQIRSEKEAAFRRDVARGVGYGFSLPKDQEQGSSVPSVPNPEVEVVK